MTVPPPCVNQRENGVGVSHEGRPEEDLHGAWSFPPADGRFLCGNPRVSADREPWRTTKNEIGQGRVYNDVFHHRH